MASTVYALLHKNVLMEWTYDDTFLLDNNYSIIKDTMNDTLSFAFGTDTGLPNVVGNQLYFTDTVGRRMGVADPNSLGFIQNLAHTNVPSSTFDRVRLYLPIGHNFSEYIGFNFDISAASYDTQDSLSVCSYYYDSTDPSRTSEIVSTVSPLRVQDRFWGSYIELYVPSVYTESRLRGSNKPVPGSINYNLSGGIDGIGLSQVAPINVSLSIIEAKKTTLGKVIYSVLAPRYASVPQSPRYQTVSTSVTPASDGDYFEIAGLYNGTAAEFLSFMDALESSGQKSYVIYTVSLYEENVLSDQQDFYISSNFDNPVKYRPIIKTSSTTSSIRVDMKVINAVDGSVTTFTAEYGMLAEETLKYGKRMMAINVSNAISPNIWNSKPANVVAPAVAVNAATRRTQNVVRTNTVVNTVTSTKPVPVLISSANIVAKNIDDGDTYLGQGRLEMVIHPYDNAFKLRLAEYKASDNTFVPYSVTDDSTFVLSLSASGGAVEVPLLASAQELDIVNGVLVFMIKKGDVDSLRQKTGNTGTGAIYVLLRNEQATTVAYTGSFILSDSAEYTARKKKVVASTTTTSNTSDRATQVLFEPLIDVSEAVNVLSFDGSVPIQTQPTQVTVVDTSQVDLGNSTRNARLADELQLTAIQSRLIN